MKKPEKDEANLLLARALELIKAGISVIPVQGDAAPREPKKPAIRWRDCQKRVMSQAQAKAAFSKSSRALGIVCGRVSGLIVIDFDDHLRYQRFRRHRPDLAESYTVKTRRGYHVYYRTSQKVPTHQFNGGDIKGERSYVVAPPSVIDGFSYREICGREALHLDRPALDDLLNYFHMDSERSRQPAFAGASSRADMDISALYQRLAPGIGRNNALYRAASVARDQGLPALETEARLSLLHAQMPGHAGHKPELASDRAREAQRTVRSAYEKKPVGAGQPTGLPNSVRETLLREQRSTVVARLLDILQLEGWQPESGFTLKEAIAAARKYGLNRKSVLQALTGDLSTFNGRQIIARRYVEYLDIKGLYSRKRGRPVELLFQTPSQGRLLWLLNVGLTPSDQIEARDVKTAHSYRRALHREYIRRLSPRLPMRLMAERLGVNPRSLRRYNRQLGVRSTVHVGRFDLTWDNLRCLPRRRRADGRAVTAGYWLETREGYRAPAWRHIGAAMLKRGELGVRVCARRASAWSLAPGACPPLQYEAMSVEQFLRLRISRDAGAAPSGVDLAVKRLWERARSLAAKARYQRLRLSFDTVGDCIAEDKVADTIGAYLYAFDESGRETRRPARRGVAYRMLKEFGDGSVYLALRDSCRDILAALTGHALKSQGSLAGRELLAPLLA